MSAEAQSAEIVPAPPSASHHSTRHETNGATPHAGPQSQIGARSVNRWIEKFLLLIHVSETNHGMPHQQNEGKAHINGLRLSTLEPFLIYNKKSTDPTKHGLYI